MAGDRDPRPADTEEDLSEAELARLNEALQRGFEEVNAGRFRPAEHVIADLRERLRSCMASIPEANEHAGDAWSAELDRRSASIENGTANLIEAAAAHARVRDVLRARRTARK